jgi:hypothetical protein
MLLLIQFVSGVLLLIVTTCSLFKEILGRPSHIWVGSCLYAAMRTKIKYDGKFKFVHIVYHVPNQV